MLISHINIIEIIINLNPDEGHYWTFGIKSGYGRPLVQFEPMDVWT